MKKWLAYIILFMACTLSAQAQLNPELAKDTTKWYNRTHQISGVTVKAKKQKYSRKDNPAVELMKKVIAAKKRTRLENHDYYQFNKYQKLTLAANDISPADLQKGFYSQKWLVNQVELCPYNSKLILPITVSETVTRHIYRKDPQTTKEIIEAERTKGINELFQTGDIIGTGARDFFTDVDIYDDQIRLLQHPFTSPIGKDAIRFYRFYIIDTLIVSNERCFHLHFLPNNQQDFGFRGDIYILADSSYQVKRCELTIPKQSGVNFVENMQVLQEFTRTSSGEWALTTDDMVVELELFDFFFKGIVVRNTRLSDYSFDKIPDKLFKGRKKVVIAAGANSRSKEFWDRERRVQLTKSEAGMDDFLSTIRSQGGYKYVMIALKALMENYVETGTEKHPSKVDIGPVNTIVTSNFIDGLRTRLSLQTTANLHPQLFFKGYYAHGWRSRKNYYKAELTYSLNKKNYLPNEPLMRNITFSSTYDVCAPNDKFLSTDKDNVFTSFKWTKVDKMMFYNRQELKLEREEEWGLRTSLTLKAEENQACGALRFVPLDVANTALLGTQKIRTTELRGYVRFSPGEKFVVTKQRRRSVNKDAPEFTLAHSLGFKGLLGGDYRYNFTEATFFKRIWLRSWGRMDVDVRAGIQWSQVPFPLLIIPNASLSYIVQDRAFLLVNNLEFLNDRYASFDLTWDLNGKLFNRLPLIKKLKWREYIGVKTLWGSLSDKNNPSLPQNAGSSVLMEFPEGSYAMSSHKPYVELLFGVHNVFRFFHIEYVRRLTYLDLPTAHKHGIRAKFSMKF